MRIKTMLRTAAVLVLAGVAGLFGVSGAWALWSVAAPADAGTLHAANLVVQANGNPLMVDGTSTTVALADPQAALTPTSPVYATLTLANHSDATAGLDLRATVGTALVSSSTPGLAEALVVESGTGSCGSASFAGASSATVPQGGSQSFCLRMSLPEDSPGSLSGGTVAVTVNVHVEQER